MSVWGCETVLSPVRDSKVRLVSAPSTMEAIHLSECRWVMILTLEVRKNEEWSSSGSIAAQAITDCGSWRWFTSLPSTEPDTLDCLLSVWCQIFFISEHKVGQCVFSNLTQDKTISFQFHGLINLREITAADHLVGMLPEILLQDSIHRCSAYFRYDSQFSDGTTRISSYHFFGIFDNPRGSHTSFSAIFRSNSGGSQSLEIFWQLLFS